MGSQADNRLKSAEWRRARRPEHKLVRRNAILAAARSLVDEHGVDGATLSAIARTAALSKANCYRYFESREAILLAVVLEEAKDLVAEIAAQLASLSGSANTDAVAEAFVGPTVARPRICKLIGSLWSVLERNVGADSIAEFKRSFAAMTAETVAALNLALPGLRPGAARSFHSFFLMFAAGAWPATHPAPVVAEVLAREEFAGNTVGFEALLRAHTQTLLRGLVAEAVEGEGFQ
jgi:AcrR family transcriptional regulator